MFISIKIKKVTTNARRTRDSCKHLFFYCIPFDVETFGIGVHHHSEETFTPICFFQILTKSSN